MADHVNPKLLAPTLEHVEEWLLAQELMDAASGELLKPVDEAAVVAIVEQYEGYADAEPFEVVVEPVFVERRKSLQVSYCPITRRKSWRICWRPWWC